MRGAQPWKTNRSRILRSNTTSAEDKLWFHLRDRRLGGFKFVRQFTIENYFVDFVCRKERVIIEVDGGTHSTSIELANDSKRDQAMAELGYKIIRVRNADVYENIDGVLAHLLAVLEKQDL
jgi:very-short-patch-repair endonuclease